jgi:hypothetical protein
MLFFFAKQSMAQQADLWLIAGQSNAVGQGDSTQSVKCAGSTAWEYVFSTDKLRPLADPAGVTELNFERSRTGSMAPAFAQAYTRLTGRSVVVVMAARGGSSCHRKAELDNYGTWDSTGTLPLFADALRKVQAVRKKTGTPLAGIIWLQGERDANAINAKTLTAAEYQHALVNLIRRFRTALQARVPFYIVQTGFYRGHEQWGFDAVRAVQEQVAREIPTVFLAYTETGEFPARGWMKDDIHYNQTGLNHIGSTVAENILK